jgi:hypothetical protein
MSQIQAFWAAVKEQTAALSEDFYYLISVDNPTRCVVGGSVVQVSKQKAAELLVAKTHRIATDEEIAAYLKYEEEQRAKYAEIEQRRLMNFAAYNPNALFQKPQAPKPRAKTTE